MSRYKIGVIFGSRSTEHEVSIVTAMQVIGFLRERHDVIPIYITKDGQWLTADKLGVASTFKNLDLKDRELQSLVITPDKSIKALISPLAKGLFSRSKEVELDVVFPLVHGLHGEDGTLQGLLELADIPYVGCDSISSALCRDKILSKFALRGAGFPVLDFYWFTRDQWETNEIDIINSIEKEFSYPVIVKPARLGSSIGIAISKNTDELKFNISVASNFDTRIIVEPCLQEKIEINCSVLGYKNIRASVCEQPIASGEFLSFDDKYLENQSRGFEGAKRIIPAPISDEMTAKIKEIALGSFRAVGARGVVRIDFLIDKRTNQIYINEINTIPGSIAYYLWEPSGVSKYELVDSLLEYALDAFNEKSRTKFGAGPLLLERVDLLSLKK
jgi:D-alanine-D-alanine ligase